MWEPREAGGGGAVLSAPASSPLGGLDGGGGVPLQALVILVCLRLSVLSTEIPSPRNPVLGEWGGWRTFAQAPEGLWDHLPQSAPAGAPPHLHPWGFSPDALCSPRALGLFSLFSLGKPTRICPPVRCMSPPQSSRPQLSADGQAVRLLKSRRLHSRPRSPFCEMGMAVTACGECKGYSDE